MTRLAHTVAHTIYIVNRANGFAADAKQSSENLFTNRA